MGEEEEEAAEEGPEWDDNAEDVAQPVLSGELLQRWDTVDAIAAIRRKFVNDETDAATIKAAFYKGDEPGSGDADGAEIAYGDFEDLETGEVFAAGVGDVP